MSLQQLSNEQLQEMSFIEIAYELLAEKKQAVTFQEIMDDIKKVLNLSDEEVKSKIAQFYTDLNIDGRFLSLGENRWGLRVWYPVDQVEEEIVTPVKTKKKKAKKVVDEDEFDDFDEVDEDEDLGFDDIDEIDEDDDILDEDDDFDELDEDEDIELEDDEDIDDLELEDDADIDEEDDDLDDADEEDEDLL